MNVWQACCTSIKLPPAERQRVEAPAPSHRAHNLVWPEIAACLHGFDVLPIDEEQEEEQEMVSTMAVCNELGA